MRTSPPRALAAVASLLLSAAASAQEPRYVDPHLGVGVGYVDDLVDVDGDGDLDGSFDQSSYENSGDPFEPRFAAPVYEPAEPGAASPRIIVIGFPGAPLSPDRADLDGDGRDDAIEVAEVGGAVSFRRDLSPSGPAVYEDRSRAVPGLSWPYAFGDLDGDGDLDAFGAYGYSENVGSRRRPSFAARPDNPFGLCCDRIALGDLDADGDLDALRVLSGNPGFLENVGTRRRARFSRRKAHRFGFADVPRYGRPALGDLDADGDLDLLLGLADGTTALVVNVGSARKPAFSRPFPGDFGIADVGEDAAPAVGDLDGDGDDDVLIGNRDGEVTFFENAGAAGALAFAAGRVLPELSVDYLALPAIADVDRDGDLDLLVGNGRDTVYFRNLGTPSAPAFAEGRINAFGLPGLEEPPGLHGNAPPLLADLDGDGDADALLGARYLENIGSPAICPAVSDPVCPEASERAALSILEDRPGREQHELELEVAAGVDLASLGDPTTPDGPAYALCVYDGAERRVLERGVDLAGTTCGDAPCWKRTPRGSGYRLRSPEATWDRASLVSWSTGAGGSRLTWRAVNRSSDRQPAYHHRVAPALAHSSHVTVQLRASNGVCLSATLYEILRQEGRVFVAR